MFKVWKGRLVKNQIDDKIKIFTYYMIVFKMKKKTQYHQDGD